MKIAFCFAGQGSQYPKMGLDIYNEFNSAKKIYDQFPEIKNLCFNDETGKINETKYAQKCMLLTSYVFAKILEEKGISPEYACGLSLGEYSALAFADAWSLEDSIDIITHRGEIMQNALPLGTTKMAAVLGLEREAILEAIKNVKGICEIANYNCPGQIVITGDNEGIENAAAELLLAKAKRVIELNVSGAFHSSLLTDAGYKLREVLDSKKHNTPKYKIIYNISGKEENGELNDILQKQISNSVYFEDSIRYLINQGVDTFVEIGPGKTLTGFIKKINREATVYTVTDLESLNATIGGLLK